MSRVTRVAYLPLLVKGFFESHTVMTVTSLRVWLLIQYHWCCFLRFKYMLSSTVSSMTFWTTSRSESVTVLVSQQTKGSVSTTSTKGRQTLLKSVDGYGQDRSWTYVRTRVLYLPFSAHMASSCVTTLEITFCIHRGEPSAI